MTAGGDRGNFRRPGRFLRENLYGTALWRVILRRGGPEEVARQAEDRIPGDARIGDALFTGSYTFQGETLVARTQPMWEPDGLSLAWMEEFHGFLWIRHLRAAGDELASLHARKLIDSWLESYGRWHPLFWRADILGNRVAAWLLHEDFLMKRADDDFRRRFRVTLTMQARHLAHLATPSRLASRPVAALRGLFLSGLLLNRGTGRLRQARALLPHVLAGTPGRDPAVSPTPSECVGLLEQLITLRWVLLECGEDPAAGMVAMAVRETASCLGECVLGDHQLGRFHGGTAGEAEQIRRLLNASKDARDGSPDATGYRRISDGGTIVLADFGLPPPGGSNGPLAFEMSDADQRVVVNCGPLETLKQASGVAPSGAAAHSTLVVAGAEPRLRHRRKNPMVTAERAALEDGNEITGLHRGYQAQFGITHLRRLALTDGGRTLTGTDTLTGRREHPVAIRFHLHPKVHPVGGDDSHSARLNRSGRMWEFRFDGEVTLSIEPSRYVDNNGDVTDTWQLVLKGRYSGPVTAVSWRLSRLVN